MYNIYQTLRLLYELWEIPYVILTFQRIIIFTLYKGFRPHKEEKLEPSFVNAAFTLMPINTVPHHPEFWRRASLVLCSRCQSPQHLARSAPQGLDSDT